MDTGTVNTLNRFLRGEIAATETYQQAMKVVADEPAASELKRIHVEHRTAANELRKHVHEVDGEPDQGSGAWGAFAKTVEGAAGMLGRSAALRALKEGEESGQRSYVDELEANRLPSECQNLVAQLLTQTNAHINTLDQLLAS